MKIFWSFLVVFLLIGCRYQEFDLTDDIQGEKQSTDTSIGTNNFEPTRKVELSTLTSEAPIIATGTIIPSLEPEWELCSPLAEHEIINLFEIVSSPYNPPPMGKDDRHQGVDFAYYNHGGRTSILGEGVTAILGGWVAVTQVDSLPYGNSVMIETPFDYLPADLVEVLGLGETDSIYHLYAHMEKPTEFVLGQWLKCGELLGVVGMTGYNIPVAHLHLETRIGPAGWRFGGMAYYDTQSTELERSNYELWRMSGIFRHFDPMQLFVLDK